MSMDGEVREVSTAKVNVKNGNVPQKGYIAGSKAVDSLDRLMTSIESFFHPSNSGTWTLAVSSQHMHMHMLLTIVFAVDNLYSKAERRFHQAMA